MLKTFEGCGVILNKEKYYKRLLYTPVWYVESKKYKQPENPCGYMGQKKNQYGLAIKELAYQAGSYKYFVDLFGGSGSASVAVPHKKDNIDVYNEKADRVKENFKRYTDKSICLRGIKEIQRLQDFLLNGGDFLDNFEYDTETAIFDKACKSDGLQAHEVFVRYADDEFKVKKISSIKDFMLDFYYEIAGKLGTWTITVDKTYSKEEILNWASEVIADADTINTGARLYITDHYTDAVALMDFTLHYKVIKEILKSMPKLKKDSFDAIEVTNENQEYIDEEDISHEENRLMRTLKPREEINLRT